jgi:type IV pilus assembly protein PilC
MTTFVVTYTTRTGRRKEITLDVDSPSEARRTLRQRGILADTLVRKESTAADRNRPRRTWRDWFEGTVPVREKALFASKLSVLVDAGVPILRGLDLMRSQQKSAQFRRALMGMIKEVNEGSSLGQAMRRWPRVFDNLSIAMVEAGEAGGVLDETLQRLARLLEETVRLRNQVRGALGYPLTVFVLAIVIFLALVIFLIPTFEKIFTELNAELPWFTQALIRLSELLRSSYAILLLGILMLGVFLFGRYYATPAGRRQVDGLLLRIPLFGDLFQKTATAQFCRTLAALSRAGVPILMALEVVHETTSNSVIGDAILASRTEVSEGVPLSAALITKNVFPFMMTSMLAIGEETGDMDRMISKVADFYEDEVTATVKVLTSLIEPFMIVVVGGVVGSILLAMYLPMFSIFQYIK